MMNDEKFYKYLKDNNIEFGLFKKFGTDVPKVLLSMLYETRVDKIPDFNTYKYFAYNFERLYLKKYDIPPYLFSPFYDYMREKFSVYNLSVSLELCVLWYLKNSLIKMIPKKYQDMIIKEVDTLPSFSRHIDEVICNASFKGEVFDDIKYTMKNYYIEPDDSVYSDKLYNYDIATNTIYRKSPQLKIVRYDGDLYFVSNFSMDEPIYLGFPYDNSPEPIKFELLRNKKRTEMLEVIKNELNR